MRMKRFTRLVPHVENLVLQREHLSLFELVRYDQVTHIAVRSGDWSEPSTWANNNIPASGSRILIPLGVEVQVNQMVGASIATIRVDGTLSFDPSRTRNCAWIRWSFPARARSKWEPPRCPLRRECKRDF